jgi:hypothetical protein
VLERGPTRTRILLNKPLQADSHVIVIQLICEQILYFEKLVGLSFNFEVTPRLFAFDTLFVAGHEVTAISFELSGIESMSHQPEMQHVARSNELYQKVGADLYQSLKDKEVCVHQHPHVEADS